jgi:hypothetical protein
MICYGDKIKEDEVSGSCNMHGRDKERTRVYPKVSGLAAWSENCNGTALCH